MIYKGKNTKEISFPLGGIGSGCIGLAGNGSLIDWEVFNHADKGRLNDLSHFAVRAEKKGKVIDFRILNGDLPPGYTGKSHAGQVGGCRGFGWGPDESTLANLPHFRKHTFAGEYPCARIDFEEPAFPGKPSLNAWSVLEPGNGKDSSLPAAFFEIDIKNDTKDVIDYTAIGVLGNPWGRKNTHAYNKVKGSQLTVYSGDLTEKFDTGDLSLTLCDDKKNISYQEYFFRGAWRDHQECYYYDMMRGGRFVNRTYKDYPEKPTFAIGLLASHFTLKPGEHRTTRFIISWSVPYRRNDWKWNADEDAKNNGVENCWKNYYATIWKDSAVSGKYAKDHYEQLYSRTKLFHDELFASTLPPAVIDGISANISTLKSPTCLRLEDGTFYGWEGVGETWGSCEGSCAHVWNYAQALPFLFPEVEKSMRASHLNYSVDEFGGSHFRILLPLGIKANPKFFRPCADGQFGDVMKIYRDWKVTGDDDYLRKYWPTIRKTIEYAWSKHNPDQWDPKKSGVLTGRQHHTLDMELIGPNAWLTGHYLGALKAGERMARFMHDDRFADECRKIYEKGHKYLNEELFNGEYFNQKIDLSDYSLLEKYDARNYWDDEHKQIKYQILDGCGIDSVLAQTYADLYGLGDIFDPEKDQKALKAIYKYNFKKSMRNVVNLWRIYSVNDEGGVMICTWPHGGRPVIPLPYNSETMHGFEWAFATHLAFAGMTKEAEAVAKSIRKRYDGERRNPWNEIECGNNYARSMASYGLLNAYSGFAFDRKAGMLGFAPKGDAKVFQSIWCLGEVWGSFRQSGKKAELRMLGKAFTLKELNLNFKYKTVLKNGKKVTLAKGLKLEAGDVLTVSK